MEEDKSYPIKYMRFGSPLMNCILVVSKDFIDNNKIELNTTRHKKLKEIKFLNEFLAKNKITYIPGGCQFNAMCVFNWMLDKDNTDIIGFLGKLEIKIFMVKFINIFLKQNRDRAHITDFGASISILDEFV